WLEMSRDESHGGGDWGFTKCLWSPTRKHSETESKGSKWPYWENVLRVEAGDPVLHLRGIGDQAAFVGYSTASIDGFETSDRPPQPGQWSYATAFYRVNLKDYRPFETAIGLHSVFSEKDQLLRQYFSRNKALPQGRRMSLFYVVQSDRLQC